jgi:hypothetical protein
MHFGVRAFPGHIKDDADHPVLALMLALRLSTYRLQDLSTGQQVFLDPGFNLSELLPPTALASCSAVEVPVAGNTTATAASQPSHNVQHVQVCTLLPVV